MTIKQHNMQLRLFVLLFIVFSAQLSFGQVKDEIYDDETIDNTVISNDKKKNKKKDLKDRKGSKFKVDNVFVGTTFSLVFGNPLFVDVSPFGGYLFGKYFALGIGGTYIYSATYLTNGAVYDTHIYGARVFANVRPFPEIRGVKGLYLHVEGEYLNHEDGYTTGGVPIRKFVPAVNVGLGYNTAFDKGFAFMTEILINPLWFSQLQSGVRPVYGTPWNYRIGIYYAF